MLSGCDLRGMEAGPCPHALCVRSRWFNFWKLQWHLIQKFRNWATPLSFIGLGWILQCLIHREPILVELLIGMVMQFILLGNRDFWHGRNMNSGIDTVLFHQWLLTQQLAYWLGYYLVLVKKIRYLIDSIVWSSAIFVSNDSFIHESRLHLKVSWAVLSFSAALGLRCDVFFIKVLFVVARWLWGI
jgi:hypothetical protein